MQSEPGLHANAEGDRERHTDEQWQRLQGSAAPGPGFPRWPAVRDVADMGSMQHHAEHAAPGQGAPAGPIAVALQALRSQMRQSFSQSLSELAHYVAVGSPATGQTHLPGQCMQTSSAAPPLHQAQGAHVQARAATYNPRLDASGSDAGVGMRHVIACRPAFSHRVVWRARGALQPSQLRASLCAHIPTEEKADATTGGVTTCRCITSCPCFACRHRP